MCLRCHDKGLKKCPEHKPWKKKSRRLKVGSHVRPLISSSLIGRNIVVIRTVRLRLLRQNEPRTCPSLFLVRTGIKACCFIVIVLSIPLILILNLFYKPVISCEFGGQCVVGLSFLPF